MLRCATVIKNWSTGGRDQVSNARVDALLHELMPQLQHYLQYVLLIEDTRHVDRIITEALGRSPPKRHETTICRKCGYDPTLEYEDFDFDFDLTFIQVK
jgi:hypothetical protein